MPDVSLFILAHNEAHTIEYAVLDCLATLRRVASEHEILIIDDGSTDDTNTVARALAEKYETVRVVTHPHNMGYGSAQKTGFRSATYEVVAYVPGDYQVRIDAIAAMLPCIAECDIVVGTRRDRQDGAGRVRAAHFYNFVVGLMFGLRIKDIDSVKVIRKTVLDSIALESGSANVDVELMVKAHRMGFRIEEIDIAHYPRTQGEASGTSLHVMSRQLKELIRFWLRPVTPRSAPRAGPS